MPWRGAVSVGVCGWAAQAAKVSWRAGRGVEGARSKIGACSWGVRGQVQDVWRAECCRLGQVPWVCGMQVDAVQPLCLPVRTPLR